MAQLLHPTTPENDEENVSALFRYCEKPMALLPGPVCGDTIRDEAHHAAVTNAAAGISVREVL